MGWPGMSPGAPAQAQRGRAPVLTGRSACLADYVLALEAEIRTLKHKFQTLEEQLGGVLEPLPAEARPPAVAWPPADARPPAQAVSDAAAGEALACPQHPVPAPD